MIHLRKKLLTGFLALALMSFASASFAMMRDVSVGAESGVTMTLPYEQNSPTAYPQTKSERSASSGNMMEEGSSPSSDHPMSNTPYTTMMNVDYYGSPFFGVFGLVMMILWWVVIIWAVVAFIRWLGGMCPHHGGRHDGRGGDHSAMEVLKTRYAKGEIDRREFEEKKKDLL